MFLGAWYKFDAVCRALKHVDRLLETSSGVDTSVDSNLNLKIQNELRVDEQDNRCGSFLELCACPVPMMYIPLL
jgi:hypothetical protein